jgi:hypothetical protein
MSIIAIPGAGVLFAPLAAELKRRPSLYLAVQVYLTNQTLFNC